MDTTNVETWKIAEIMIPPFFPQLSAGIEYEGKTYQLKRNNVDNKLDIDWAIFRGDEKIAVLDTELKPKWTNGEYPYWSVARYCWNYNKGKHDHQVETVKIRYYREYPDLSFWMPIRFDWKRAGIITGRKIIEAHIGFRPRPEGFARDIEIFEFPKEELVFCDAYETTLQNYIITQLEKFDAL